ncbi:DNA topoisomerase I [Scheffersomyces xylosifermentans]|uniref:DNA topoisomerase I n=1 Tax=Scheffersomyces xylosifermentans TaxID=1304137 RepID=UPI00315DC8A8
MSSSEDEVVLTKRVKKVPKKNGKIAARSSSSTTASENDDDLPLSQRNGHAKSKDTSVDDDEDSVMSTISKKKRKNENGSTAVKKQKTVKDEPVSPKQKSTKASTTPKVTKPKAETKPKMAVKKETKPTTKKEKKPKEIKEETPLASQNNEGNEEEEEEGYKWWEAEDLDGEQKWESLVHNGVLFPPEYEPLPSYVKLYYDGKPVTLSKEAEEVAGFYGAMLETEHAKNPVFQKNFFNDFLSVIRESNGSDVEIKEFEKLDFSKMYAYFEKLKEEKKSMTKDEKKAIKEEKERLEEPYKTCFLNGRKELVGNFRIEPPGLFRGRGAHPKTGKLKRRVYPESVTLNISADAKVPEPPAGHQWGEIRHDNTVTWLAMWKENIADSFKYVRFAASSSIKGVSDFKKFETARRLKDHVEAIRKDYTKLLKSELMQERQMATATYLIDVFALRAGGEKGDDEADTVGCCSLRFEHITLKPPNKVIFDFLGKDSIRFYQEVEVDKQVFKNLRIFKKSPKQPGDDLFDRINPSLLNKHLQNYMKGLTAKVFRTYNASKTMQDQLNLIKNEGTVAEKVVKFNAANRTVAILCNHQRTVSKSHGNTVQKINDKLKELVWQKIRLKRMILELEPKLLKKDKEYFSEINDLAKEDEEHIHHSIIQRQTQQVLKKMQRDNEKLQLEKQELLTEESDSIKEKLEKIQELKEEYDEELRTGKTVVKKGSTVEKLKQQIETIENRIVTTTLQLKDKEDNSEVSLGTSKLNYIDPRLTVMFSKKFDVPIEKLFTKTLRDKFKWAIESADENWSF